MPPTLPRILLVEDDSRMRRVLEMLLSERFAVESTASGAAALAAAFENVPDLALLDLLLPGEDGMEVLRRLHTDARTRGMPVIMISGVTDENARIEALQAGAVDFLVKPFSERELVVRMDHQLRAAERRNADRRESQAHVVTEAALRRSHERFKAYVEHASEGIWCCELDAPVAVSLSPDAQIQLMFEHGLLSECNDAMARMYGFEAAAELEGAKLSEMLLPSDEANLDFLRRFIAGGYRLVDAESHERDREGRSRVFLNNMVGIVEGGYLMRAWGTQRDITERRRVEELTRQQQQRLQASEALLRAVIEGLSEPIYFKDRSGNYVLMNSAAAAFVQRTPAEVIGLDDAAIFSPETGRKIREDDRVVMTEGGTHTFENTDTGPDGRPRVFLSTKSPYLDADGNVLGVMGISRDVTESKRAAAERERLLAEAETANRAKDEFLATLSHELRTPLNAIVGWTHMLKAGTLDPAQVARAIDVVDRNARSLTQLISDLLDLSHINEGKLRLRVQPVHLASVVGAAVETVSYAAEVRQVRIDTHVDADASLLTGDPDRLQQVVWNLLTNAIAFTPKGGRITVRAQRVQSHMELAVEDTGAGIDHDFLPHVFDRFRQADGSRTRRHGGLGLGLSIVRHVVEMHGGSVSAYSEGPGRGARFVVSLPLAAVAAARDSTPAPIVAEGIGTALAGRRILVVDDERDARLAVSAVLAQEGATVVTAASAAEAFELLRRQLPDLVVSDIGMEGEDGYALIGRIRGLPPEQGGLTPAAALTAFGQRDDRIRALNAGFQLHLTKPVNPAELIAAVTSLLREH